MSASSPIRAPKSMILGHSYIKLRFRIEKVNVIRTNPTLFLFLLKGTKPRWHRIGWWTFPRVRSFRIWSRKHSVRAGSCQWNRYSLISRRRRFGIFHSWWNYSKEELSAIPTLDYSRKHWLNSAGVGVGVAQGGAGVFFLTLLAG